MTNLFNTSKLSSVHLFIEFNLLFISVRTSPMLKSIATTKKIIIVLFLFVSYSSNHAMYQALDLANAADQLNLTVEEAMKLQAITETDITNPVADLYPHTHQVGYQTTLVNGHVIEANSSTNNQGVKKLHCQRRIWTTSACTKMKLIQVSIKMHNDCFHILEKKCWGK